MRRPEALLCLGVGILAFWVLLSVTYPWAGFVIGLVAFIALAGFMVFVLASYFVSRRPKVD